MENNILQNLPTLIIVLFTIGIMLTMGAVIIAQTQTGLVSGSDYSTNTDTDVAVAGGAATLDQSYCTAVTKVVSS